MEYPRKDFNEEYFYFLYQLLREIGWLGEEEVLRQRIGLSKDYIDDLQIEYTRLFINAYPTILAPPYESYYRSYGNFLNDVITQEVVKFYQKCGYRHNKSSEFPDHITSELQFLGLLIKDKLYTEYNEFLNTHFKVWFPEFKKRVMVSAEHLFYSVIVRLIEFSIN